MSALVSAGREFLADEDRRAKRRQKTRLTRPQRANLRHTVRTLTECVLQVGDTRSKSIRRGQAALDLFDYNDDVDEIAATVITDILHAVASHGLSPQRVLDRAAMYYVEERPR